MRTETGSQGTLGESGGRRHEVHSFGRLFGRHTMRFLSGKAVFGWAFVSGDCVAATDDTSQSDAPLLLTPGIGQGLGEAGDREVRRRGSINDRRNDARRQEGKGGEDWSLTPGRYVGVAPEEPDEDFDFEEELRSIHIDLKGLNEEAVELAARIARNFEELGA